MANLYGWMGKILWVDLTEGKISTIPTENYVPKFVGGRGIGARIHWEEVSPKVKAFDPENIITFMTGPLAGTFFGTRLIVQGVCSGGYPVEFYARTTMGGHFAAKLKFAGYDGIVVKGKSPKPVYLLVNDGNAEIRDAQALWGEDTYATQQRLWSLHDKDYKMVVIGPAGENLVRMAAIISDDSSCCGTGGYGAVMGSKNLKAIAVKGTGAVPVARPKELLELAYYTQRMFSRKEGEKEATPPMRQYRKVTATTDLYKEGLKGTARIGIQGCFGCSVACGMSVKLLDGSDVGGGAHKCNEMGNSAVESNITGQTVGRVHYARVKLLDLLGLGNDEWWGSVKGFLDQRLLNAENTGMDMSKQGTQEFTKEMIYKTVYRQGIFDKVAEGMAGFCLEYLGTKTAKTYYALNSQKAGIHGGLRMGNMGAPGMSWNEITTIIASAVSNCGSTDVRNFNRCSTDQANYIDERIISRASEEWKNIHLRSSKKWFGSEQAVQDLWDWKWGPYSVPIAILYQGWRAFTESLATCVFDFPHTTSMYTPDYLGDVDIERRLYCAVTGIDLTEEERKTFAKRLYMQERAILARQGHLRKDDWFSDAAFDQLWDCRKDLSNALDEFYTTMGMDVATAIPKRSTFESLGLKDVADDLGSKYGVSVPA